MFSVCISPVGKRQTHILKYKSKMTCLSSPCLFPGFVSRYKEHRVPQSTWYGSMSPGNRGSQNWRKRSHSVCFYQKSLQLQSAQHRTPVTVCSATRAVFLSRGSKYKPFSCLSGFQSPSHISRLMATFSLQKASKGKWPSNRAWRWLSCFPLWLIGTSVILLDAPYS